MVSPDQAWEALAGAAIPLPARRVPLGRAGGAFLAEDVAAGTAFPPAAVAAMDGYAVRAEEASKARLPVAFTVPAGTPPPPLPVGFCARIFTGGVLPAGADAVVPQEEVQLQEGQVDFPAHLAPGANIRQAGEVFAAGSTLLRAGTLLTPARVALLAAAGVRQVSVHAKPRVAVLATGSELVSRDARLGQIYDSNTPLLAVFLAQAGFPLVRRRRVSDRFGRLQAALQELARSAEVVVTTGGVSVGELDLVPQAVANLGGEVLFHGVSMQPGKPMLAARLGTRFLVGLPGNPLSVLVGFRLFLLPLLRALAGESQAFSFPWLPVPLAQAVVNKGGRWQFRPALLVATEEGPRVEVLPWKGSHDLVAGAQATVLARLAPQRAYRAGEVVPVLPLA
ncbi:MAG: molybdopterin molybdotransferase MoeA [Thermoanaerobaculum sp.]|nr:molybdopterin molybdotransferase MoeA [Thermoanaerobaculum sp.]